MQNSCFSLGFLFVLAVVGCSGSGVPTGERYSPEQAAEVALQTYDTNGDGKIAAAELDKCPALKYALPRIDTADPADRAITAAELAKRLTTLESQSERMGTMVQITSSGRPVSGATVTLQPEPFMGENLPTYTVTTDESGGGAPQLAGSDEPLVGIPLGFYRIEISAPGQAAQVVRGCEVADDSPTASRMVFSLEEEAPQSGGRFGGR